MWAERAAVASRASKEWLRWSELSDAVRRLLLAETV